MHGRLKVKTTAEQELARQLERKKKLQAYQYATSKIFTQRGDSNCDEETLNLTAGVLSKNPDFFTLWNIRAEIALQYKSSRSPDELKIFWKAELSLTESCLQVNPKSYGCWQHRCFVMNESSDPDWAQELKLCNLFLQYDERNFHCWDYRRFVVKRSEVSPEDELAFTTEKISSNFSNYSSWHYRSKLLPQIFPDSQAYSGVQQSALMQEFELVQNAFFTDPNDQSAWFYHRWLLGRDEPELQIVGSRNVNDQIRLTFNSPVKVIGNVTREDDSSGDVNLSWICPLPDESSFSYVWNVKPVGGSCTVKVVHGREEKSLKVSTNLTEEGSNRSLHLSEYFSHQLSAAQNDVLTQELDSCQQLAELEPENKWVLLTVVLLMKAIDGNTYHRDILDKLNQLATVDSYRANYYRDLASRFVWEFHLGSEEYQSNPRKVLLTNQSLTKVFHSCYLHSVTHLDLSHNNLTSTTGINVMQDLQAINLSHNTIRCVRGLYGLPELKSCDLSNNCLEDQVSIQKVEDTCPSLKELNTENNPLSS